MTTKHIVAGSAGHVSQDGYNYRVGPTMQYALSLSSAPRPKFSYIGTATGDNGIGITRFYDAASHENVAASHLQLFPLPNHDDIEDYLLSQDVIWVGGGSVANLLAVWRVHNLDLILRRAWESGVILCGVSAGAICWSVGGPTDSFGVELTHIDNGLGLVPFSCGVHYDSEERRRPLFHELIASRQLPAGYATDDGVMVHFVNEEFHAAISDRADAYAYRVYLDGTRLTEERIQPQLLTNR